MVFSYYRKLTSYQRRIYRQSDEIHAIKLPNAKKLQPLGSDHAAGGFEYRLDIKVGQQLPGQFIQREHLHSFHLSEQSIDAIYFVTVERSMSYRFTEKL